VKRWTEPQELRLKSAVVGYMELNGPSGGMGCGGCFYAAGGDCSHKAVLAPISPTTGGCNLFFPSGGTVAYPPEAQRDFELKQKAADAAAANIEANTP
jgi:hypothetical protein